MNEERKCINCGNEILENWSYCVTCGKKTNNNNEYPIFNNLIALIILVILCTTTNYIFNDYSKQIDFTQFVLFVFIVEGIMILGLILLIVINLLSLIEKNKIEFLNKLFFFFSKSYISIILSFEISFILFSILFKI